MDLHGLPIELEQFVRQEIAEGKYPSPAAVVSAALRLLQAQGSEGQNGHPFEERRGDTRSAEAEAATFTPCTPLAQRLWAHRQHIVASGRSLLDWDDLEHELRERRGEHPSEEPT